MKRILISIILCAAPLFVHAKSDNLVIINNLKVEELKPDIIGIYVTSSSDGHSDLRRNKDIEWGENLIKKPIEFGEYKKLKCYDSPLMQYNIRIDFSEKTPKGKPMQYFHKGCVLSDNGSMIHQWIVSLNDGSSPWKGGDSLLRDEMREMNRKYDN